MADSKFYFQATRSAPEWQIHRAVVAPVRLGRTGIFARAGSLIFKRSLRDEAPANLKVGATHACRPDDPAVRQGAGVTIPVARLELPQRRQLYTPGNRTDNPR